MHQAIVLYLVVSSHTSTGDDTCALNDGRAGQCLLQLRARFEGVGLRFLRIQKTGSTTLHHAIEHFCSPKELCTSKFHLDWNQVHDGWTGPIVAVAV